MYFWAEQKNNETWNETAHFSYLSAIYLLLSRNSTFSRLAFQFKNNKT